MFSEQPRAQGDGGAGQERPGQRVHPGQPLPAVCVPSGSLAGLQDQPLGTHRVSQYIRRQWRARESHSTEDVLCWIWESFDFAVSTTVTYTFDGLCCTTSIHLYLQNKLRYMPTYTRKLAWDGKGGKVLFVDV